MLLVDDIKEDLLNVVGIDFKISFKRNDKGIITFTFMDEDTKDKVNLKFNENTNILTIAPREMEKELFKCAIKQNLESIKEICIKFNKN